MKRRKLTPKIEKMFKKLELKYNLKNADTSITLRETNVLNSDAIHNFKSQKLNQVCFLAFS